jgi:glycine cleavage system aminomethyltransferase T
VRDLVRRATGLALEPSGVAAAAGAWWCAAAPDEVLVVCERTRRTRLLSVLREHARRLPGLTVADTPDTAIALVGRRATDVLAALDALGTDLRGSAPFGTAIVGGATVRVLLQTDRRALVLVAPDDACAVWHALADAGQPFGLSCVGSDAVERFAMLDAIRVPAAPAV